MMLKRLAFWSLMPFVLPQALWVRKNAPRFAGASGRPEGSTGSGPAVSLLAIGDSIIAGVGASTYARALVGATAQALATTLGTTVKWRAVGQIGATSEKVHKRLLTRLKETTYQYIIVSAGVNDITSLKRTAQWRTNLTTLLDALLEKYPDATLGIAGIPPLHGFPLLPSPLRHVIGLRARTFDAIIQQEAAKRPRVVHLALDFDPSPERFSADGYHPSEVSHGEFGVAMAAALLGHETVRA
ncbi:MAG: SGNH/GDSL hydrolase family protein [Bacteroidota bacterium]